MSKTVPNLIFTFALLLGAQTARADARFIEANGDFETLPANISDIETTLLTAAAMLGPGRLIEVSVAKIDMTVLMELSQTPKKEPIGRAFRERLGVPVDLADLLLFIDDVLAQNPFASGRVVLTPHMARKSGVLIHPDEVFARRRSRRRKARRTEHKYRDAGKVFIDPPIEGQWAPAADGDPPSEAWHGRFPNPTTEEEHFRLLKKAKPGTSFPARAQSLLEQLRQQGATAFVDSSFRYRERGFLMYGAFILDEAETEADGMERIASLDALAKEYDLKVPITWLHPDGWDATKRGAAKMRDAFRVVYATKGGALNSNHYDGNAIDLTAIGLPRKLTLSAPDGAKETFDLSHPNETRDLSLTPKLIEFIEAHFGLAKNFWDYPHWNDAESTSR